jgi:CBS domain-containing protein
MSLMETKISDVDWQNAVVSCRASATLQEVVGAMQEQKSGTIIVVDAKNIPVGIFTERDYLNKVAGQESNCLKMPVSQFMTKNPFTMEWTDSFGKALLKMRLGGFRNIVIVNADQTLGAVLTVKDGIDFLVHRFVHE